MTMTSLSRPPHKLMKLRAPKKMGLPKVGKKKAKKKTNLPPPSQTPSEEEEMYQEPVKRVIRPNNQLNLMEDELKETMSRVLTGDDPNVPRSVSKYSYKDRCFKPEPPGQRDHMAVHFTLRGIMLHKDSIEYHMQKQRDEKQSELEQEQARTTLEQEGNQGSGYIDDRDSCKNQFNYSERSTQTFNNPLQSRGVTTEPPPLTEYADTVSQYQVYDSYVGNYKVNQEINQREENDYGRDKESVSPLGENGTTSQHEDDIVHSAKMEKSLKIMERLVNQNADNEIYQDFKYWEDASDKFREGKGSLLPLWRFSTDRTKRKQVTALCWNHMYSDLFAVGYGSHDSRRKGSGMICCFSLKNTSFPEYTFTTESGIVCLDFHPQNPSLLAVGCYNGTVMVYNVCCNGGKPIYSSSIKSGKHSDLVWQVQWQDEDMVKEPNFFSISTDGHVANWSMSKNELKMEPVMQLKSVNNLKDELEEFCLSGLTGGNCFDFNRKQEHLFIVGTEDGNIHKCSKAYSGQYLKTYRGHCMTVYAVKWNPFHERIFISCSADWTVKIWDHELDYPLLSLDMGNAVGDVCWSPYSSSVFSVVTSDGKVHVFDLAENRHEPLCEQKVVKRAKLTRVVFNSRDYILIVGDDRGGVSSMKLSPNLRKLHLPVEEDGNVAAGTNISDQQREKLDKILSAID